MTSFRPKKNDLQPRFLVIDFEEMSANGMVLGRVCAKIATLLRGKHKTIFTPGTNCGDHVIVLNSAKLSTSGNKLKDKIFYKHTGYIGNMKKMTLEERMDRDSREVVQTAVKRMLPRGPLGRAQLRMLHVFSGTDHKYNSVKFNVLNAEDLRRL
jgi:large subunit ribosomal protein L13